MLALLAVNALSFAPTPMVPARTVAMARPVINLGIKDMTVDLKDSLVPTNTDKTLRNVIGYQALAWGVCGLLVPGRVHTTLLGATATTGSIFLMRGLSLANLALANRFTSGTDADAASSGFVWFALWTWALKSAVSEGAMAGYVPQIATFNLIMALVCARRQNGLWNVVTDADTKLLDGILPRDYSLSMRNFVGFQMLGWALGGLFFPAAVGAKLGLASTPLMNAIGTGNALTNLVLGGRVLGGSDEAASANGVMYFGGWAALIYLAKSAGVLTGANIGLIVLWNAASAAYCAWKLAGSK